jgi:hypothetical protein
MPVTRRLLSVALAPLVFSLIGGVACYASAGPTLGLFLGGLIIVTLLIPPLTLSEALSASRMITLSATLLPLCVIWLVATFMSDPEQRPHITEWLAACAILIAYAIALAGLSVAFRLTIRSAIPSAALTVIIGLAWLTWPIWASSTWSGGASEVAVARKIAVHPGLAINGQLSRPLGNWTEQSLAYHLTELGQSVNFILPQSAWPSILLHSLIGLPLLILAHWLSTPGQNCEATRNVVPDSSDPRITTD